MTSKPFCLSVKAIVHDGDGRCLVIRRSAASKNNAGMWDLPGGKCDPGESMDTALRREVLEETSLTVRLKQVVGSAQWEMPERMVAYLILDAEIVSGELHLSD